LAPLSPTAIEEKLDDLLGAVLSSRRTAAEPAKKLAKLDRKSQNFTLRWAEVISKSNSEMAFQFVEQASRAFELMDSSAVELWIIEAMDIYDRQGLYPGSASFRDVDSFASRLQEQEYTVSFKDVVGILEKFVKGISGRTLEIHSDTRAWTDTDAIYLPDAVNNFDSEKLNFYLLKVSAAFLLAQNRYGTFRVDERTGTPVICDAFNRYRDQARALGIFEMVERERITYRLKHEFPGLGRQLDQLNALTGEVRNFASYSEALSAVQRIDADVADSLDATDILYLQKADIPQRACFQGAIDIEAVRLTARARVERERKKFRSDLSVLVDGLKSEAQDAEESDSEEAPRFNVESAADSEATESHELVVTIDGQPVTPPQDMVQTTQSILQDFGKIPDEYLVPAGDGGKPHDGQIDHSMNEDPVSNAKEVFYYDEWDYRRRHYRKNWCVLTEKDMHPADEGLIDSILCKHSHLVGSIRKSFEALRGDDRMLKRQKFGDDIDIDAIVESYVDALEGNELNDRLFIQSRRVERNLAVIFMVDVSGSTKGWINDAERESLVLLSEALRVLGDRYAIYGFSGMTRKRCELYRIKTFDDPYDSAVKSRIAGIRPQDYTRMGVIIRHLTQKLIEVEAKTRVLITISDGKPDDYDGYRGEYGIEDTRQALMEAKYSGIHPFCITIDSQAHDYLPRMYGNVNYTLVNDVRRLPLQVSDIYRKITT